MDELSAYLQGDYRQEVADRDRVHVLAQEVVPGLLAAERKSCWPYQLLDGKPLPEEPGKGGYSYSTNAMILHALVAAAGPLRQSVIVPASEGWLIHAEDQRRLVLKAVARGLATFWERARDREWVSESQTFGRDDPLTLGLALDLDRFVLECTPRQEDMARLQELSAERREKLWPRAVRKFDRATSGKGTVFDHAKGQRRRARNTEAVDHAFPMLALVHMVEALLSWQRRWIRVLREKAEAAPGTLGKLVSEHADLCRRVEVWKRATALPFFTNRVHRHLSSSQTLDTGFDAAELVLSLEGLIRCRPHLPHPQLLDQFFAVLRARQAESPYWKPTRPVLATPQGTVLLPVSVEIANSLLRVCYWLDRHDDRHSYFSSNSALFTRYADWLYSRVSIGRIETDGSPDTPSGSYCGWHSEHLGTEDRIHLWDTSQVLLFLVQYSGMLRRHIARTTLKKSYLQQRWLKPRAKAAPSRRGNGPEDDETGEEEAARKNQLWQAQVQNWEPLPGLSDGSPYRIYTRISDYVRQHAVPPTELKRRYSILLYGPPGTGKTSLAEAIAKTLGFPLVTVTPSDFLAAGPGDVERRAKELFEALQWQSETLILLDEIDHFLLDRESRLYRDQTGIFQFLTPGMLTKIKGLHDAMRPLFIIATNYAERIDPAIKRPGRIDDRLPLLPFDSIRRAARLETHCSREIRELRKKGASEAALEWEHSRGEVVHATRLWTDGELIELVRSAGALVTGPSPPNFGEALKEAIPRIRPTITLASYSSRFRDVEPPDNSEFPTEQEPFEEFYLLVYLACENSLSGADPFPAELSQQDRTMIVEVVKRELEIQREDFEEFRKRVEPPELTGTGLVRDVGDPDLRGVILRLLWEVAKEASP